MGTDVTSNLGLIIPDLEELIKNENWPNQNASNMDKIDATLDVVTDTWVPVWTAAQGQDNPVIGVGGSLTGQFAVFYDRLVVAWLHLDVGGSGFHPGNGSYKFTLPVPPDSTFSTDIDSTLACAGWAFLEDANESFTGNNILCPTISVTNVLLEFRSRRNTTSSWNESSPIVLEIEDEMTCYFTYLKELTV